MFSFVTCYQYLEMDLIFNYFTISIISSDYFNHSSGLKSGISEGFIIQFSLNSEIATKDSFSPNIYFMFGHMVMG